MARTPRFHASSPLLLLLLLVVSAPLVLGQSNCHNHGTVQYCDGPDGKESPVTAAPATTGATDGPASTTASPSAAECHFHAGVEHCGDHNEEPTAAANGGMDCHFHAGVEHCVPTGDQAQERNSSCDRVKRDYDIPLRIGALFVVMVTSAIGSFGPMLTKKFTRVRLDGYVFTAFRQFGTGVVVATAYVHLMTHAELLFQSRCAGELKYEATVGAVAMGGVFVTFLVEYFSHRLVDSQTKKAAAASSSPESSVVTGVGSAKPSEDPVVAEEGSVVDDTRSVAIMEAGILFHSILIGIVLVVTADSFFVTLFVVIIFHQMFEGFALGTRIVALPRSTTRLTKLTLAGAFTLITPIGMAIGLGVLHRFNGNDWETIIALATLDSISAGILVWVGLVDLLARDWIFGYLKNAKPLKVGVGMAGLVGGMVIMGVLGKWA